MKNIDEDLINPVGRPPKEVDWSLFENLCGIQCTQSEICSVLKISHDVLITKIKAHYGDSFANIYKRYSEHGKSSLRRRQYKLSEKNAAMAIWLGKNWLGQSDKIDERTIDSLTNAIKSIAKFAESRPASEEVFEPVMEAKQSLLHQEQTRQEGFVSP